MGTTMAVSELSGTREEMLVGLCLLRLFFGRSGAPIWKAAGRGTNQEHGRHPHARTHTYRYMSHTYVFPEKGAWSWRPWRLSFLARCRVALGDVQACGLGGAGSQQRKQTGPAAELPQPARGALGLSSFLQGHRGSWTRAEPTVARASSTGGERD